MRPANLTTMFVEYLDRHVTMALATTDGRGGVNCATVYYAPDERGSLLFAGAKETLKARHIELVPAVSAVIDDAGRAPTGAQIRGRAAVLTGKAAERARERLKARHPLAAEFYDNPDLTFFRLDPEERYIINFAWGVDWRQSITK